MSAKAHLGMCPVEFALRIPSMPKFRVRRQVDPLRAISWLSRTKVECEVTQTHLRSFLNLFGRPLFSGRIKVAFIPTLSTLRMLHTAAGFLISLHRRLIASDRFYVSQLASQDASIGCFE